MADEYVIMAVDKLQVLPYFLDKTIDSIAAQTNSGDINFNGEEMEG